MMILMISLAVLSFNLSCGSVEVVVERCLCLDGKRWSKSVRTLLKLRIVVSVGI